MEVKSIHFVKNIGTSPACVNRKTGVMLVNESWFKSLPFEERFFILLHEMGHVVKNTSNEFEADNWAFETYVKMGHSLEKAITALTHNLKFIDENRGRYKGIGREQKNRVLMQIIRAKVYDYKILKSNTYKDWYNKNFTD